MAEFADAQDLGAVTSVGLFHSLHALKTEYAPVVKLVYTMVLVLPPQGRLLEYNKEVLSMKRLSFFVLCLLLALSACSSKASYQEYIQDSCGLDISGSTIISEEDTHGGFLGDGALMVKFDCTDISNSVLLQLENWNELPLTENLQLIMYGGTRDGVAYMYNLAKEYGIPEITNGCYFFWDRHSEATDSRNDQELFDRASYNFSLAVYDFDTSMLYLFEFDT